MKNLFLIMLLVLFFGKNAISGQGDVEKLVSTIENLIYFADNQHNLNDDKSFDVYDTINKLVEVSENYFVKVLTSEEETKKLNDIVNYRDLLIYHTSSKDSVVSSYTFSYNSGGTSGDVLNRIIQ